MKHIINLTDDPYQRHVLLFDESEIILDLRYLSPVQQWAMWVSYGNWEIKCVKLSCGTLHMRSANKPFDFMVTDNFGLGMDPFRLTDFSDGRCSVWLVDRSEMELIRGVSVQV